MKRVLFVLILLLAPSQAAEAVFDFPKELTHLWYESIPLGDARGEVSHEEWYPEPLRAFAASIRKRNPDQLATLNIVNRGVNSLTYRKDIRVVGLSDFWMTPNELVQRAEGDCEDFVLAKAAILRLHGFSQEQMHIVLGQLADGRHHAVLAVRLPDGWRILDNLHNGVRRWDQLELQKLRVPTQIRIPPPPGDP